MKAGKEMKIFEKAFAKVIAYVVLSQVIFSAAFYTTAEASVVSKPVYSKSTNQDITIQATEYVWMVKKVNGVVYKRLFNRTTGRWVGDWVRA